MFSDPSTWYLISFTLFGLLLGRTLWRSATFMLDEQIKIIGKEIEEASHMKKEAEELLESVQKRQQETQEQVRNILALGEREVQQIQRDAMQERKEFLASQKRQLEERLSNLETISIKELNENVVHSAITAAERVIQQNLDQKLDAALIQDTVKTAGSLRLPVV